LGKKVTITYGRIGIDKPATKEVKPKGKPFKSKEEAKAYVEEKIREKTNKGYIEK
jgi:predicted DNA-binding WGR domain protein